MNKEAMKEQLKKAYEMWEDGEVLEAAILLHKIAEIIVNEVEVEDE